jgi:hypothetical protein
MRADLLVVVEDTFEITDRGVVVAPMMLGLADLTGQLITVELRRPDGTTLVTDARVEAVRISPWRPGAAGDNALRFPNLRKSDIPIGTEIWKQAGSASSDP